MDKRFGSKCMDVDWLIMGGFRKSRLGEGGWVLTIILVIKVLQMAVRTSREKQLDPLGPIASRGGPYICTSISKKIYCHL